MIWISFQHKRTPLESLMPSLDRQLVGIGQRKNAAQLPTEG